VPARRSARPLGRCAHGSDEQPGPRRDQGERRHEREEAQVGSARVDDDAHDAERDGRHDEDAAHRRGDTTVRGGSALVRFHAPMVARARRPRQGPLAGARRRQARPGAASLGRPGG